MSRIRAAFDRAAAEKRAALVAYFTFADPDPTTSVAVIEAACRAVVDANPKQVAQYKGGNPKIIGFFVGQVMKESGGKANPALVNQALKVKLAG